MKNEDWSVILLQNLYDVSDLIEGFPLEKGEIKYSKNGVISRKETELQVSGSLARYNHPKYKNSFYAIKNILESIIQEKLYPTYYYDRFYFKGQKLEKHTDREACEISVSLHISNNLDYDWPIWFHTPEKSNIPVITSPGDAVLYKGIEIPHWRDPLKGDYKSYYHQVFFHYVRRDGIHVHNAFDAAKILHTK